MTITETQTSYGDKVYVAGPTSIAMNALEQLTLFIDLRLQETVAGDKALSNQMNPVGINLIGDEQADPERVKIRFSTEEANAQIIVNNSRLLGIGKLMEFSPSILQEATAAAVTMGMEAWILEAATRTLSLQEKHMIFGDIVESTGEFLSNIARNNGLEMQVLSRNDIIILP